MQYPNPWDIPIKIYYQCIGATADGECPLVRLYKYAKLGKSLDAGMYTVEKG